MTTPTLVACLSFAQLASYRRKHNLAPADTIRVTQPQDVLGRHRQPILLLPRWWDGTKPGTIQELRNQGWETIEIPEEET